MRLFDPTIKLAINPSLDRLLFVLSFFALIMMSPYFVWSNNVQIFRIIHLLGNAVILYIIIEYHKSNLYNIPLLLCFSVVSIYTLVGGTENSHITYVPLLTMLYISLKKEEQIRVFDYFVSILAIIYAIGLGSYFLRLLGLNIPIGTAMALNPSANPYLVYFGHIEETDVPTIVYRFCSIFDEAGVVGTLNGLILASIGISKRNIKSIIILLAGLISFSLAFYVILIFILLYNLNIKYFIITSLLTLSLFLFSGDIFTELIANRFAVEDGKFVGDNRTDPAFDDYYNDFIAKGGNNLIFGKGAGTFQKEKEEEMGPSSYKTKVIDIGILGIGLILSFYIFSILSIYNTKKGWFLGFVFIVSAYQRPDLINFSQIVLFLGGILYIKELNNNNPLCD